ncbi:D-alanine--D-alanine ligase family protein [Dysosmobacter sp.]
MKIVVLAGGISTERAVSLVTGSGVCRALRENGHQAILVDLFLGVADAPGDLNVLFDAPDGLCPEAKIEVQAPDLEAVKKSRADQSASHLGPHVLELCALADIVFLGLHGQDGEDGRIQAALDLLGVPYTGAGHLASAIAMDKAVSKQIMDAAGIPTPKWKLLEYGQEDAARLAEELPMPCVVKTIGGGSSLGVYLPEDRAQLRAALGEVLRYGAKVLVEERIYGRELTVAVLGERWLPAVETVPAGKEFDYEAKYQAGAALETCPADLTPEQMAAAGEMALRVHKALGLEVYSRTDMILDEQGRLWCLEANSLPGMTPTSFVPKEAGAVGMSYNQLCEEIVQRSYRLKRRAY